MRPADCLGTRLRETEVQDLSFLNQILNGMRDIFDGHIWIDPVLVVEINAVGSEALQRFLDYFPDVPWLAVKSAALLVVEAELRCDNDLVAERRECFSDKLFVCIGAVNFGCIEERDALFTSGADDLNALIFISGG